MSNRSLAEIIAELNTADKVELPVYPAAAAKVRDALAAEDLTADRLKRLIGQDPALVCNLFRAANSSFFAGLQKTSSIEEALQRLGLDKSREVLAHTCREEELASGELLSSYLPSLWRHAVGCAMGARWLAERTGYQGLTEQAYLAGLLHDIGKLYLIAALEMISADATSGVVVSPQLADEILRTKHVEQGLRLVEDWNLPESFASAIREHHDEEPGTEDIVVCLVRLANLGCRKIGLGTQTGPDLVLPTTAEAQFLGIDEISLAEFEIMLEDRFLGGAAGPASDRPAE